MGGATLQLYYLYKPLIHDVDVSKNEKQTAFPIKTFYDRIELRPKTTNNKRMQTVLKEVVEVSIKPLSGSKVNSAFHPSEVDKLSTRNAWKLNGKK